MPENSVPENAATEDAVTEKTSEPVNPYRSILFVVGAVAAIAAIVLAAIAGSTEDAGAAASTWIWAGHAFTLAVVGFAGELVVAGVSWRISRDDA